MKKFILILIFSVSAMSAPKPSNTYGNTERYDSKQTPLTQEAFQSRFELQADILEFNLDGTVLIKKEAETRRWRMGKGINFLKSNWFAEINHKPVVAIRQHWEISKDNVLTARIEKYETASEDSNHDVIFNGKPQVIETQIKDFQPVIVPLIQNTETKTILRLTPTLIHVADPTDLDMPLAGTEGILYDEKGQVWANRIDFSSKYNAIKTHKGTLAISFVPFKGAKEIGEGKESQLVLNPIKGLTLYLQSKTAIVPGDLKAKVYGLFLPDRKTKGLNSVNLRTTEHESEFLAALKD